MYITSRDVCDRTEMIESSNAGEKEFLFLSFATTAAKFPQVAWRKINDPSRLGAESVHRYNLDSQ